MMTDLATDRSMSFCSRPFLLAEEVSRIFLRTLSQYQTQKNLFWI